MSCCRRSSSWPRGGRQTDLCSRRRSTVRGTTCSEATFRSEMVLLTRSPNSARSPVSSVKRPRTPCAWTSSRLRALRGCSRFQSVRTGAVRSTQPRCRRAGRARYGCAARCKLNLPCTSCVAALTPRVNTPRRSHSGRSGEVSRYHRSSTLLSLISTAARPISSSAV